MPDVSISAAEQVTGPSGEVFPPTVPASVPPSRSVVPPPVQRPQRRRPGRRWLRVLRAVALVIALPAAALGIGLLVAWIVHQIRGNPTAAAPPAGPQPSISPVATTPPPPTPAPVTAPADWVVESDPPSGLAFRHPPGWIRRTALPEILRFAPVSAGSTTPGIEGIGAGIEPDADPSQALQQFVTRAYGGQPQVQNGAISAVAGAHPGEQQEVVSYVRGGVPVSVVVHSWASGGRSVVVLARAASAEPARAGELEAQAEASVQLTG
jgi:hypothetical protein